MTFPQMHDVFRRAAEDPTIDNQHAMFERMEEIFLRLSAQFPRNRRFQSMLDAARVAKARTPELREALEAKDMTRFIELKSEIRKVLSDEVGAAV